MAAAALAVAIAMGCNHGSQVVNACRHPQTTCLVILLSTGVTVMPPGTTHANILRGLLGINFPLYHRLIVIMDYIIDAMAPGAP